MANNMAVMVRRLRQFIVDEKTRISRENQTLGATEKKPVPESLLDLMITDIITQEDIKVCRTRLVKEKEKSLKNAFK
jgi:hypothetical protein